MEFNQTNGWAFGQMHLGGGMNPMRWETTLVQDGGQIDGVAAGVGCAQQFFRIGPFPALEARGAGEQALKSPLTHDHGALAFRQITMPRGG